MSEAADTDDSLDSRLRRLLAADAGDEEKVLEGILTRGVDQGWFLRPDNDALISVTSPELERFHHEIAERPPVLLEQEDPWATEDPDVQEIDGSDPGWVVLTQRCDLVRSYCQEPLVELARGRLITDSGEARSARLNSPRIVAVTDPQEDGSVWAADLRQRALLPKDVLDADGLYLCQPVSSRQRRKAFRLRLGQRYWRDPVPTHLVERLQRPLVKAFSKSKSRTAKAELFEALLGEELEDGSVLVLAMISPDTSRSEAEEDWQEVMDLLVQSDGEAAGIIEPSESGVMTHDELSIGQWLSMFKFDLDEITYGSKASNEQADPPV